MLVATQLSNVSSGELPEQSPAATCVWLSVSRCAYLCSSLNAYSLNFFRMPTVNRVRFAVALRFAHSSAMPVSAGVLSMTAETRIHTQTQTQTHTHTHTHISMPVRCSVRLAWASAFAFAYTRIHCARSHPEST